MTEEPTPLPETFEAAMDRLQEIVSEMERADLPLEDIVRCYEEGVRLRAFCEGKLKEAEQRVQILQSTPRGEPRTAPFEPSATPPENNQASARSGRKAPVPQDDEDDEEAANLLL